MFGEFLLQRPQKSIKVVLGVVVDISQHGMNSLEAGVTRHRVPAISDEAQLLLRAGAARMPPMERGASTFGCRHS